MPNTFTLAQARTRKTKAHPQGLLQEQLEKLSGVNQSIISRAEQGISIPATATIAKLAAALGLKPEQLVFTRKGGK